MPKRTRSHEEWLLEQLKDPETAAIYIDAAFEDSYEMGILALSRVDQANKGLGTST